MTNDVHYWCKPLRDVRAIVVATVASRVRKLWSKKTIMIIDEVSMMGLSMLSAINGQCKIARSLDRTRRTSLVDCLSSSS